MSISNDQVKKMLEEQMTDAKITISGDGYKYQAEIISPAFKGLSTIKRHQLVYSALNSAITSGELHALTIQALTPDEA